MRASAKLTPERNGLPVCVDITVRSPRGKHAGVVKDGDVIAVPMTFGEARELFRQLALVLGMVDSRETMRTLLVSAVSVHHAEGGSK